MKCCDKKDRRVWMDSEVAEGIYIFLIYVNLLY